MAAISMDVIVVGARCAGSPTAMLLARKGYKVLTVDKATFPSDTISTHLVHTPGVAALRRWGLKDELVATGCQAIDTYAFDLGPITLTGHPGTPNEPVSYGPRRTVLDKAARRCSVAVRERGARGVHRGRGCVRQRDCHRNSGHDKGGGSVTERARVVVGADGRHSLVARDVKPEQYNEKPPLLAGYYSYWSGVPMNGRFEAYDRGNRSYAAWPTNDDMTLLVGGWPMAEFDENKKDIEGNFMKMIDLVPEFAERLRGGKREDRFYGAFVPTISGSHSVQGGRLWEMPATTRTSSRRRESATRSATPSCAQMLLTSHCPARARSTMQWVSISPLVTIKLRPCTSLRATSRSSSLRPRAAAVDGSVYGNQQAMDGFARVFSGETSPAEFFSEENVGRIFAAAQARQPS
jgi:hypothetical protein